MLSLEERAEVDIHFDAICDRILDVGRVHGVTLPEELQPSTRPHSAMYHINLSGVFPLTPDWQACFLGLNLLTKTELPGSLVQDLTHERRICVG